MGHGPDMDLGTLFGPASFMIVPLVGALVNVFFLRRRRAAEDAANAEVARRRSALHIVPSIKARS